jgi:hypothetical protein
LQEEADKKQAKVEAAKAAAVKATEAAPAGASRKSSEALPQVIAKSIRSRISHFVLLIRAFSECLPWGDDHTP